MYSERRVRALGVGQNKPLNRILLTPHSFHMLSATQKCSRRQCRNSAFNSRKSSRLRGHFIRSPNLAGAVSEFLVQISRCFDLRSPAVVGRRSPSLTKNSPLNRETLVRARFRALPALPPATPDTCHNRGDD